MKDKTVYIVVGIIVLGLVVLYLTRKFIFKKVIGLIISRNEGGYVSKEQAQKLGDLGGETKFGISKRAYPNLNIATLTREQAEEIYYNDYFKKLPTVTDINLFYQVLDMSINAGVRTALKLYKGGMTAKQYKDARIAEYSTYKLWSNPNVRKAWTDRTNRNVV